jgi:hypothetical protein
MTIGATYLITSEGGVPCVLMTPKNKKDVHLLHVISALRARVTEVKLVRFNYYDSQTGEPVCFQTNRSSHQ